MRAARLRTCLKNLPTKANDAVNAMTSAVRERIEPAGRRHGSGDVENACRSIAPTAEHMAAEDLSVGRGQVAGAPRSRALRGITV